MRWARPGWESTAKAWRGGLGVAAACAALTLAACGSAPAAPTRPPAVLADIWTLPTLQPVQWSASIAPPSTFSIAPDGSAVAGASVPVDGGPAAPWAFTAAGATIPLDGLADGAVFALSGQSVLVGPGISDQTGPVTLITPAGRTWSANAVGPIFGTSNLSGSRLAILDGGSASLRVLRVSDNGVQSFSVRSLGSGASAQFDDAGEVLVADAQRAALLGPSGAQEWAVPLRANALPRSFVLDRDGAGVTAATSGNDNTLYQFAAPGGRPGVAWSQPLAAGGDSRLVAGPDGRVAIGSAGEAATLAVYRTQDGALQWQDTLPSTSDGQTPIIGQLAFGPNDTLVAVVGHCDSSGDSCLLLLGSDGSPLGTVNLGGGGNVALAANGNAAASVVPGGGGSPASLTWFDLSGLWNQLSEAPSAPTS